MFRKKTLRKRFKTRRLKTKRFKTKRFKTRRLKTRRFKRKGGAGGEDNEEIQEPVIQEPVIQEPVIQEPVIQDNSMQNRQLALTTQLTMRPGVNALLNVVCKNPDNCIAFGQYNEIMRTYFSNFADLSLINNNALKRLGMPSNNGFVVEVPFTKNAYTAYTALKCSVKSEADNLYYEWFVGNYFINKQIKKLPCFVETFGCYYFNSTADWEKMQTSAKNKTFTNININSMLTPMNVSSIPQSFEMSCVKNKLLCLLIQHFDNVRSLYDEIKTNASNINFEFMNLYYQVYYGLTLLGDKYTHYDLHPGNVLLYKPYTGNQFITMKYHRNGKIYEFNTEYICKIIDYGRNYIETTIDSKTVNTDYILKNYVCSNSKCNPACGERVGYTNIQGTVFNPTADFYNIFPNIPNMSYDLRLVIQQVNLLMRYGVFKNFTYKNAYGTPQNSTGDTTNITTIFNLRDALENFIGDTTVGSSGYNAKNNSKKYGLTQTITDENGNNKTVNVWKQAATMEIFDDGRDYIYTISPDKSQ